MRRRASVELGVVFCAWTLIGALFASQDLLYTAISGEPAAWNALLLSLAGAYTWIPFTFSIFWVCRAFPLTGRRWRRNLPAHLLALAVLLPLDSGSFALIDHFILHALEFDDPTLTLPGKFLRIFIWSFGPSTLWYCGVAGAAHALEYERRLRERELRASELQSRLTEAQLHLLDMQLQPHFLFNTLHAISALVHEDARTAGWMIGRLSELLERSFGTETRQEIALREELEMLQPYLEIEKTRFGERLVVREDVDPEALDARVPNLILQPLVENGIRHGVARRLTPGWIEVRARRRNGRLEIEVRDNGGGLRESAGQTREGLGLRNARARLRSLYGDEGRLELRNLDEGGLGVLLSMPFRAGLHAPD